MTKAELIQIVESDSYHKDRQNPTDAEIRLYLHEVNYHCPLCGKELQYRGQVKPDQKLFQIAERIAKIAVLKINFRMLKILTAFDAVRAKHGSINFNHSFPPTAP